MEIVVCVKQVADPEALTEVSASGELTVENRWVTGFFDEVAIEQALQLRKQLGGRVTALTVGTGKAADALRRAIAMGANRAIQVDDPACAAMDGLGVARALAAVLTGGPADLVICGRASMDQDAGCVGPALAELLGWPCLSEVISLQADDQALQVQRAVEGGTQAERCGLPAVVTAGKGLAEPRVPPVTGVMKAMRAKIDRRKLADLGLSVEAVAAGWSLERHQPPARRAAVRMVQGEFPADVDALLAALRDKGVLA